jgi:tetratricopeptide (TPR) repeat protein
LAEVANDHRAFFPYIGLSLAVVWWLALQAHKQCETRARLRPVILPASCAVALLVLCGHAVGTYQRNTVWRSEETLWRDVVQKSPTNGRALMNYGLTQMSQGRYGQAKELFEQARLYTPNYPHLEINLGIVNDRLGEPALAEQHFVRALQLQPDFVGGHYFYARWLVDHGRSGEAIPHLQRAIELSPALSFSRALLMSLYYARGAETDLSALVRETLAIAPADPVGLAYANGEIPLEVQTPNAQEYYNRGVALSTEGRHLDAALTYRQALKFDPQFADSYNNLGWSLAKLGFYQEAAAAFAQALRFRPEFALAQNNLAWVKTQVAPAPAAEAQPAEPDTASEESIMQAGLDALYIRQDPAAAVVQFRRVLERTPTHYGATFQLARALDRSGKSGEAWPLWETVLKMAVEYHDEQTVETVRSRLQRGP